MKMSKINSSYEDLNDAEYECVKCGLKYNSMPGPTFCPKCGSIWVKWVNWEAWREKHKDEYENI